MIFLGSYRIIERAQEHLKLIFLFPSAVYDTAQQEILKYLHIIFGDFVVILCLRVHQTVGLPTPILECTCSITIRQSIIDFIYIFFPSTVATFCFQLLLLHSGAVVPFSFLNSHLLNILFIFFVAEFCTRCMQYKSGRVLRI